MCYTQDRQSCNGDVIIFTCRNAKIEANIISAKSVMS